jgi:hypothetical protein
LRSVLARPSRPRPRRKCVCIIRLCVFGKCCIYLEDDDGCGLDLLVSVESAVDVVVDGLHDGLALLELLDAAEHVVKVVFAGVEGGEA